MPNGGYPMNQFIQPGDSSLVIQVKGTELSVFEADPLRPGTPKGTSLLTLTEKQTGELRRHLNYWFDARAGYIHDHARVEGISYDY